MNCLDHIDGNDKFVMDCQGWNILITNSQSLRIEDNGKALSAAVASRAVTLAQTVRRRAPPGVGDSSAI